MRMVRRVSPVSRLKEGISSSSMPERTSLLTDEPARRTSAKRGPSKVGLSVT